MDLVGLQRIGATHPFTGEQALLLPALAGMLAVAEPCTASID